MDLEDFCSKVSNLENCDKGSRSLDSLLEGIANEAECMEADSSSGSFAEQQLELEEGLTPSQKTMRLLGITESQIHLAKLERSKFFYMTSYDSFWSPHDGNSPHFVL